MTQLVIRCDKCKTWKGINTNKPSQYKFKCDSCELRSKPTPIISKGGDNFAFKIVPLSEDLGLVVKRLNELNHKTCSILGFINAEDVY